MGSGFPRTVSRESASAGHMQPPIPISGIQLAVRAGFAAGLSLGLAQLLALDYPIYALVAAVIVTDLSPVQTRKLGRQRMAASVVGAFCGAVITLLLPPAAWAVALSIAVAMLVCVLVRVREGAKVAGYVCASSSWPTAPTAGHMRSVAWRRPHWASARRGRRPSCPGCSAAARTSRRDLRMRAQDPSGLPQGMPSECSRSRSRQSGTEGLR
jgi:hypothetical protein